MHTGIAIVSTWLNGFNSGYLTQITVFNINLVCRQGNGYRVCYLTLIILFQYYSFVWTVNSSEYCY